MPFKPLAYIVCPIGRYLKKIISHFLEAVQRN